MMGVSDLFSSNQKRLMNTTCLQVFKNAKPNYFQLKNLVTYLLALIMARSHVTNQAYQMSAYSPGVANATNLVQNNSITVFLSYWPPKIPRFGEPRRDASQLAHLLAQCERVIRDTQFFFSSFFTYMTIPIQYTRLRQVRECAFGLYPIAQIQIIFSLIKSNH